MPDHLSIANLLGQLIVDRQQAAIRLVEQAGRMSQRRFSADHLCSAIALATSAVDVAKDRVDLRGVALIYRSYARLTTHQFDEYEEAILDCNRAIRDFATVRHNRILALTIRALIELEIDEEESQARALTYYEQVIEELDTLVKDLREHHQLELTAFYQVLRDSVASNVEDILTQLMQQSSPAASFKTVQDLFSHRLPIVLPLWPLYESVGLEHKPITTESTPDQIEIDHLKIRRRRYAIEPIEAAAANHGLIQLRTHHSYLAIPLKSNTNGQFILVRRQDHPDREWQFVVVNDSNRHEALIDKAKFFLEHNRIRVIGSDRQWNIMLDKGSSDQLHVIGDSSCQIIGVVEALLTPIAL